MSRIAAAALDRSAGFAADLRYAPADRITTLAPIVALDPAAAAWAEGYAAGVAIAEAEAGARAQELAAAQAQIEPAFLRFDAAHEEALRQRLHETVTALCEAAIAPLALDPEALVRRVERAAAMLTRADDQRLLRLHPLDLAAIAQRLPQDLAVEPDTTLERGGLRMETQDGGIEDGPGRWHRAIAEALARC